MSENHGKKQYKQQQNENPAQSPELIHETEQNSSENSDYSDSYEYSDGPPEKGTLAYVYYQRGQAQKAARKRAAKAGSLLDDPKFQRNMNYLAKKQEQLKAAGWTSALPPQTEEIQRADEINRDEISDQIPRVGFKRTAQKGPAGAFSYPEVPSPPPVPDDEDEDDDVTQHLGTLPPNVNWGLPHNEFGQPLDTEYEAVDILDSKKKTRWKNLVSREIRRRNVRTRHALVQRRRL